MTKTGWQYKKELNAYYPSDTGISLRDHFAGQALSNPAICKLDDEYPQKTAYAFADAMIAERERTND